MKIYFYYITIHEVLPDYRLYFDFSEYYCQTLDFNDYLILQIKKESIILNQTEIIALFLLDVKNISQHQFMTRLFMTIYFCDVYLTLTW